MTHSFLIVETQEEEGSVCSIVPSGWLNRQTNILSWPNKRVPQSWVLNNHAVETGWINYHARVIAEYDTYEKARRVLPRAEETSDLGTDSETPTTTRRARGRRPEKHMGYRQESGSEEDNADKIPGKLTSPLPTLRLVTCTDTGASFVKEGSLKGVNVGLTEMLSGTERNTTGAINSSQEVTNLINPSKVSLQNVPTYDSDLAVVDNGTLNGACSLPTNKDIMDYLEKIMYEVTLVKHHVCNLEKRIEARGSSKDIHQKQKELPLPLTTVENFQHFDCGLSESDKEILKGVFVTIGGSSLVDFIGRCLRRLFLDEVAVKYSLRGQRNNYNFSATNSWICLKEAALSAENFRSTEREIEKAVIEWFRHAGERLKKKTVG